MDFTTGSTSLSERVEKSMQLDLTAWHDDVTYTIV
jgi:hypothetical protein